MANILIKNCTIVPMEKSYESGEELFFQGDIVIEGKQLKYVGPSLGDDNHEDLETIIDGTNMVALPGLINGHTHAAMTLLRSYADDLPLMKWLETKIWPVEAKMTREDIYWGTMLGIMEMLLSGTTTFVDMYDHMPGVAMAVEKSGIRGFLSRGLIGIAPNGAMALDESEQFIQEWHGKCDGRIKAMLGPHAPYTCPPAYLEKVMKLAEKYELAIHIHVAETQDEINNINSQYGVTPVKMLEKIGLFNFKTLAAHCVHLTEEDMASLKKYNVGVIHNPQSNMKLASGIAPVPEMLELGIPVALGTDGASSNNNLDMFEEIRTAALLHKVNKMDPTTLPAYKALEMATKNGALALGMEDKIGMLKEGMLADIILLDIDKPHLYPKNDLIANIVYSAQGSDVDTVIVNGEIVVKNRNILTINKSEVFKAIDLQMNKLMGK